MYWKIALIETQDSKNLEVAYLFFLNGNFNIYDGMITLDISLETTRNRAHGQTSK